jgi:cytochrome c-type biogenesis protein CcmH
LLSKAAQARHEKQYAAAAKIYKQLAAANQMNADAWADYADTTGTLQNNKLAGEPEAFIAKALALDANHPKALWLKASADEEVGRYDDAIATWQRLQGVLPQDSQDAKIIAANVQRDREAGTNGGANAGANGGVSAAAATSISGEVSISSTLSSKATPGATLFIVAKSVEQPGPPVAVYRGSVSAWPVQFTLDDSSAMVPGRNLSSAKHVTVEARISRSGQAQPSAGDLRGKSGVIAPSNHQPLKIVIDEVVS